MILTLRVSEIPPSVNRAWRRVGNRTVRSQISRDWEEKAIREISGTSGRLPSLCYWTSQIHIPVKSARADLDNMPKAIHDALVRSGVAPDDRYLVSFSVKFWEGDYVLIYVKEEKDAKWHDIMKTSKMIGKRMAAAKTHSLDLG